MSKITIPQILPLRTIFPLSTYTLWLRVRERWEWPFLLTKRPAEWRARNNNVLHSPTYTFRRVRINSHIGMIALSRQRQIGRLASYAHWRRWMTWKCDIKWKGQMHFYSQLFPFKRNIFGEHIMINLGPRYKRKLLLAPVRVLSIAARANALWPIKTPLPTCANQDAWAVITPTRP